MPRAPYPCTGTYIETEPELPFLVRAYTTRFKPDYVAAAQNNGFDPTLGAYNRSSWARLLCFDYKSIGSTSLAIVGARRQYRVIKTALVLSMGSVRPVQE
ncbi:hypothetical protein CROQUDRAFT_104181 [Cronartium quercuum f. sp. fusiforme G11]|uniref:Uncharacterized protein n=1 Tax=Cronartium quercuum f. sp. fusiforme G11 TaxID=708437 RepID=A0A9P6NRD4_9BASI|nr:hypothetical protein CROQUDRAFT_104181 [Cronartium quercuum f. sp. fusiforme G11]